MPEVVFQHVVPLSAEEEGRDFQTIKPHPLSPSTGKNFKGNWTPKSSDFLDQFEFCTEYLKVVVAIKYVYNNKSYNDLGV